VVLADIARISGRRGQPGDGFFVADRQLQHLGGDSLGRRQSLAA
jgi:hypothetical protein